MPYRSPTYLEILERILIDYQNQIPGCDISEGSDIYIKATATASVAYGMHSHIAWLARQPFPDTCDGEELERHAGLRNITRKAASIAAGSITFTGQENAVIPVGTTAVSGAGVVVETTEEVTIVVGIAEASAKAQVSGTAGNLALASALTVQNGPAGLAAAATVSVGFTGGVDLESDSSLKARLLDILRMPPAGGRAHDYIQWAKSVAGVEDAIIYPLRLGLGTVTLVILTSGVGAARIPGAPLLDAVTTYINTVRPVTVKTFQVLAPTAKLTDITVAVKPRPGYLAATVKGWVNEAIIGLLNNMAPNETLYLAAVRATVQAVEGVLDSTVTLPAANVVPVDDGLEQIEMIVPGIITVNDLA